MRFFILSLTLVILSLPAFAQQPSGASLADLAEKLLPAVVNIASTQKIEPQEFPNRAAPRIIGPQFPEGSPFQDFFDEMLRQQGMQFPDQDGGMQMPPASSLGSGFIIDADKGYIVTNNHVIKDADEIKITLHDDTVLTAKLLGADEKTDLALLQADLKGKKIAVAPFGNSDAIRVGDPVFAIGNPFGLGGTLTSGIISARARDINAGPYDDFLQTDASINRGNSGGPMFNMQGEVIGVNSAIFSPSGGSVGIGFAIPSNLVKPVIDQLAEFGKTKRGWLGVKIQTVTDDIAKSLKMPKTEGALVASVAPDSPAGKAGIKPGDVILTFNEQPLREMRQLPRLVAAADIGKTVPLTYWRNGNVKTVQVDLGELEKAEASGLTNDSKPSDSPISDSKKISQLGIEGQNLTAAIKGQLNLDSNVSGVLISKISPNSDAARKGLRTGDIITAANQTATPNLAELNMVLAEQDSTKTSTVLLLVLRGGDTQFIAVDLVNAN